VNIDSQSVISPAQVPYHLNDLADLEHHEEVSILADNADRPENLSVLTLPYPVPVGLMMALDLFGKDVARAKRHFHAQMRRLSLALKKQADDKLLACQFFVDVAIADEMMRYIVEELKLGRLWDKSLTAEGRVQRMVLFTTKREDYLRVTSQL
jgi:hypothetical protein